MLSDAKPGEVYCDNICKEIATRNKWINGKPPYAEADYPPLSLYGGYSSKDDKISIIRNKTRKTQRRKTQRRKTNKKRKNKKIKSRRSRRSRRSRS